MTSPEVVYEAKNFNSKKKMYRKSTMTLRKASSLRKLKVDYILDDAPVMNLETKRSKMNIHQTVSEIFSCLQSKHISINVSNVSAELSIDLIVRKAFCDYLNEGKTPKVMYQSSNCTWLNRNSLNFIIFLLFERNEFLLDGKCFYYSQYLS